jgi:hypothetical protein
MKHPVLTRAEFPSLRCVNAASPQLTLRHYSCLHSCALIWGARFPVTSSRLRPVSCLYDILYYPIYPISCLGFSPLFLLALIFWCHSVPYQNTPYYTTPPSTTTDRTTLHKHTHTHMHTHTRTHRRTHSLHTLTYTHAHIHRRILTHIPASAFLCVIGFNTCCLCACMIEC